MRFVRGNDETRGTETERAKKKGSRASANVMKANGAGIEGGGGTAGRAVQYVGQTTIIVRHFLVYYTASN